MHTNGSLAKQLSKIAKLLTLKGENPFKVKAFQKAAETLKKTPEDVAILYKEKRLNSLPNVGKSIEKEIIALLETGESQTLKNLEQEFPKDIVNLVYTTLTPKTLQKILAAFSPASAEEILELIETGKLQNLKGFGKKSVTKLKEKILIYIESRSKWLLHYALQFSEDFLQKFRQENLKIHLAGDALLARPVVNELQFVLAKNKEQTLSLLENLFPEIQILNASEEKIQAETPEGKALELFPVSEENFYRKILELSLKNLPEYSEKLASYENLSSLGAFWEQEGFKQIPPYELYDNPRALALCKQGKLPRLISEEDLRGVVHVHTQYSDGKNSLKEMTQTAEKLGYEYIVITDHSQAASYAGGLAPEDLQQQWQEIDNLNNAGNIHIFKGIEADILADGSLDYSEEIQKQFDIIIASVHSGLAMSREKATERLSKALQNPYVNIVGHLTGRLLLSRKGYDLDFDKILEICKQKNIVIEFNANPYRMDIDVSLLPKLYEAGIKTVLTPDAHAVQDYEFIKTGVKVLRRAMTIPENVLNTYSREDFEKYFEG